MRQPSLTIHLERLSSSRVELRAFPDALRSLANLLESLQQHNRLRAPKWVISDLRTGSNVATVTPESEDTFEVGRVLIDMVLDGIQCLTVSGNPPISYNERALRHLSDLSRIVSMEPNDYSLELRNGNRQVQVTLDTHRNAENWLKGTLPYEDFGSIEGTLAMMTVRGGSYFRVYEQLPDGSERAVECRFDQAQLETIREAVGERVSVTGHVTYDRWERPRKIRVKDVYVFRRQPESSVLAAITCEPIDLTQGEPSNEFVRRLRDV